MPMKSLAEQLEAGRPLVPSHEVVWPWWPCCGPCCPLPVVDRSSLCRQGAGVLGLPIDLPLSAQCTLILASACGCPGLASWVYGCLCGPEATVPMVPGTPTARLARGFTPQSHLISLGGSEASYLETEVPFPSPFL